MRTKEQKAKEKKQTNQPRSQGFPGNEVGKETKKQRNKYTPEKSKHKTRIKRTANRTSTKQDASNLNTWPVFVLQVGLAVGDIDSIQKTASLRTLIDQAILVDNIHKRYPKTLLRLGYKECMELAPNQNTLIKKWVYDFITFLL